MSFKGFKHTEKTKEKISKKAKGKNLGNQWNKGRTGKLSGGWRGGKIKKSCLSCNKEFEVWPHKIKNNHGNYCSRGCIKKNKPAWNKGIKRWWNSNSFLKGQIPWNKGLTQKTSDIVKKMASGKMGENNPSWRGGVSFEPYSLDWTETLRRAIRERDNYICQLCSQYGISVHHVDYNKNNCNPSNLITLCKSCNSKVNFNRNYWTNYFKKTMVEK